MSKTAIRLLAILSLSSYVSASSGPADPASALPDLKAYCSTFNPKDEHGTQVCQHFKTQGFSTPWENLDDVVGELLQGLTADSALTLAQKKEQAAALLKIAEKLPETNHTRAGFIAQLQKLLAA